MKSKATTIIHIEEDLLWANFVRDSIEECDGLRLLGMAGTGSDGLTRCRALAPDIVVLDLRLPDVEGLLVVDALNALRCPPAVLLFTSRADDAMLARLFHKPVSGLIWKSPDTGPELRQALSSLAQGGTHYGKDAHRAWQRFNAQPNSYVKLLSHTELRLLPHFSHGDTDAEIAAIFGCAASTAHTHRKNIMSKLNLHSQANLQQWALKRGVFDPPRPAPPCNVTWQEGH